MTALAERGIAALCDGDAHLKGHVSRDGFTVADLEGASS